MLKKSFLIILLSNFILIQYIFADTYKILSQNGTVNIMMDKKNVNTDIVNSLPSDYFEIETKDSSYIILEEDTKSIILMPSSKVIFSYNDITLEEGFLYVKSKTTNSIEINIKQNNNNYKLNGHSFALETEKNKTSAFSTENTLSLTHGSNLGLKYYLEPHNKTDIFPTLTYPKSITANEKGSMSEASKKLISELSKNINKVIKRYSFKIFEGTIHETEIYRVVHPEKGPNVFLIVPHGNERVGTDVAKERVELPINNGSLTIVPIASAYSYAKNTRYLDGYDINNLFFDRKKDKNNAEKLATTYMKMLDSYDIDVVLTLHEGNGFKEFFGDAIIYDNKNLDNTVAHVVKNINDRISPFKYKFKQTYYPMPTTITYYAYKKGLDAYGIELTRNLPYESKKIIMHAILDEFFKVYKLQ